MKPLTLEANVFLRPTKTNDYVHLDLPLLRASAEAL